MKPWDPRHLKPAEVLFPAVQVHVDADVGPSEMTCKPCGLLMLPQEFEPATSLWVCWPCERSVRVTWRVKEST